MAGEREYRLRIVGEDGFSGAFNKLKGEIVGVESAASKLSGILGGLGLLGAATWLTSMAKDAISAAAALDDLSEATGSSVESLSRLKNISAVAGQDFGKFEQGMFKLAAGMAGIDEEAGKTAKALSYLGIQAKDPAQALEEIAVKLEGYADGANKAALARDLFGKGGAQFISLMHDIAQNTEIAGTVTRDMATESERLEKALRLLSVQGSALKTVLLQDLVPAANDLIERWRILIRESGGLWEAFKTAGSVAIVGGIQNIGQAIKDTESALANAKQRAAQNNPFEDWSGKVAELERRLRALQQVRNQAISRNAENMGWTGDARDLQAASKAMLDYTGATEKAGKAAKTAADNFKEMRDAVMALYENAMNQIAADEAIAKAAQDKVDAELKSIELESKNVDQVRNATQSYLDQADAIKYTKEELLLREEARLRELATNMRATEGADRLAQAYEDQANAIADLRKAEGDRTARQAMEEQAKSMTSIWSGVERAAEDAFMHIYEGGRTVFERLTDALKSTLLKLLYELTLKKWVISIGASLGMTGAAAASGLGGLAGGTGGLGDIFSIGSGVGNWMSGGGIFSSGIGGAFATSGVGQFLGLSAAAPFGAAGDIALTGLGTALGSAIPLIGAGLAIASMFGMFSKDPSQVKGQFQVGGSNFEDNAFVSSKFGNLGFSDQGTQYFSGDGAKAFSEIIGKLLDGAAAQMTPDQIKSASDKLAGTIFAGLEGTFSTEDFIRSYGGDIGKQVLTVVLGELNPALGEMMGAFSGTVEEVTAYANTLLQVNALLKSDRYKALSATDIIALGDAFGGLDQMLTDTQNAMAALTSESDQIAQAQSALADAFDALGVALPDTKQGLLDMIDGLDLTDESQRTLYASLIKLAPAFAQVADAAAAAASQLLSDLDALHRAQGTSDLSINIGKFTASRPWAQQLVGSMGEQGFAQYLSTITDQDFSGYDAASRAIITAIVSSIEQTAPEVVGQSDAGTTIAEAAVDWTQQIYQAQVELLQQQGDAVGALTLQMSHDLADLADQGAPQALVDLITQIYNLQIAAAQTSGTLSQWQQNLLQTTTGYSGTVIQDQVDTNAAALNQYRNDLASAYAAAYSRLKSEIEQYKQLAAASRDYSRSLVQVAVAMANPSGAVSLARQAFLNTAPEGLAAAGDRYLSAIRDTTSTRLDYLRQVGFVGRTVGNAAYDAEQRISVLQAQLDQLGSIFAVLMDVSSNTAQTAAAVATMSDDAKAASVAIATNTSATARALQRWDGDGMPETRTTV